jgi:hypothetical protein
MIMRESHEDKNNYKNDCKNEYDEIDSEYD